MVGTTQRSRGWVFTINNYTEWDIADLDQLQSKAQYYIYGREVGEQGTPHLQGYIYFKQPKSFNQLRDFISRGHVEIQRGSNSQAIDYCKKENNFTEWGTAPKGPSGQKDKWSDIKDLCKAGKFQEAEDKYPSIWIRYSAKLFGLYQPEHPVILESLENEWWVGPTGSGKSRALWEQYPDHYRKKLNKWWDNYKYQDIVAIEEWSPDNEVSASNLKIWADRYPFAGEIKGGTLDHIRPKKIIVLSNYTIEECFKRAQDRDPLLRRFKVKHFFSYFS